MSNTPLPRPGSLGLIQYAGVDMQEYAAAVSSADNAALREALREIAQFDLWEPAGPAAARARAALGDKTWLTSQNA